MANKTVYFRVGSDKAGTVTLASLVARNQDVFANDGIFCPFRNAIGLIDHIVKREKLNAIDLFDSARFHENNAPAKAILERMLTEENWREFNKIVLTTETIWGRLTRITKIDTKARSQIIQLFQHLQDFFNGYDFRIILHLRRADRYFESLWNQHIKSGGKLSFEQYRDRLRKKNLPARSLDVIDLLEESFGRDKITIKPFERQQMHNGDLIEDFLHTVGSSLTLDDLELGSSNESLHLALLETLHEVNNSHGKIVSNKELLSLSSFIRSECNLPESKLLLDNRARQDILDDFASFYDEISARYHGNRPLFLESIPRLESQPAKPGAEVKSMIKDLLFTVADKGAKHDILRNALSKTNEYAD